jgi:hypothetical protein
LVVLICPHHVCLHKRVAIETIEDENLLHHSCLDFPPAIRNTTTARRVYFYSGFNFRPYW